MGKKAVAKRRVVPVPKDRSEAAAIVRDIGTAKRGIEDLRNEFNEQVEILRGNMMGRVEELEREIADGVEGLFAFAESNRDELTEGGKRKTVELATGEIGWRFTPPAVMIRGVENVLETLKKMKLSRFIRVKKTPNKEAMLAEAEVASKVKGVTIVQTEEFFVKPAEGELEVASDVKKLKKAVG